MIDILKKIKLNFALIFSVALFFAFIAVFEAVNSPDVCIRQLKDTAQKLQDTPSSSERELADKKYALQKIYGVRNVFRQIAGRRNSNPSSFAYCSIDFVSLWLTKQKSRVEKHFFYDGARSYFQKYLKYALPLRAGPVLV